MNGSPKQSRRKSLHAPLFPIHLALTVGAITKSRMLTGNDTAREQMRQRIKTDLYRPPRRFPSSSATSLDEDSETPAVAKVRAGEYTDMTS